MKIKITSVLIAVSCTALTGCSADMSEAHTTPARTSATAGPVLTAAKLRYALAPTPDGYEQLVPPKAGSFDHILGLQQDISSNGRCLRYYAPGPALYSGGEEVHKATASYVVLIHGHFRAGTDIRKSNALGETLVALRGAAVDRLIGLSVPASCRQFTSPSTDGTVQHRFITCESIRIGSAEGKIIGYGLYADGSRAGQEWLLFFGSPGYLGEVSAFGPTVRKKTIVAFARRAHAYAERALR